MFSNLPSIDPTLIGSYSSAYFFHFLSLRELISSQSTWSPFTHQLDNCNADIANHLTHPNSAELLGAHLLSSSDTSSKLALQF